MLTSNTEQTALQERRIRFEPDSSVTSTVITALEQDDFNLFLDTVFSVDKAVLSAIVYKEKTYNLLDLISFLELPDEYSLVVNQINNPCSIHLDEYDKSDKMKLIQTFELLLKNQDARGCVQFINQHPYIVSAINRSCSDKLETMVSLAVDYNSPGIVGFLTVSGANTCRILYDYADASYPSDFTVLVKSIILQRRACSLALINAGGYLDERPANKPPICYAVTLGQANVVAALLQKTDPNLRDPQGRNLFFYLRFNGEIILNLLYEKGVDLNQIDDLKITPLIYFIRKGMPTLVRKAVLKGSKVYSQNPFYSAIHEAVNFNQLRIFNLLVKLGVNPNQKNEFGDNVLHDHIKKLISDYEPLKTIPLTQEYAQNQKKFNYFIANKVDFYEINRDGKTPVDLAEEKGFQQLANALKLLIRLDQQKKEAKDHADETSSTSTVKDEEDIKEIIFSINNNSNEEDSLLKKRKIENSSI